MRHNHIIHGIICAALLSIAAINVFAVEVDEKQLRAYAHTLAQRNNFKGAAEEYLRIATYLPKYKDDPDHLRTMMQFAEKSQDHEYSLELIRILDSDTKTPSLQCLFQYYQSRTYYYMRRYDIALQGFEYGNSCDTPMKADIHFFKALTLLRMKKWDQAAAGAQSIDSLNPEYGRRVRKLAEQGRAASYKTPGIAAGLSGLLPGAGYVYARSPATGLAAFVTTSLIAWGSYSLIDGGHTTGGTILAVFAFSWHLGGVYGSYRTANRYNDYLSDSFIAENEIP